MQTQQAVSVTLFTLAAVLLLAAIMCFAVAVSAAVSDEASTLGMTQYEWMLYAITSLLTASVIVQCVTAYNASLRTAMVARVIKWPQI